jgi:hypothetical protein
VSEDDAFVSIVLQLSRISADTITVDYQTVDGSAIQLVDYVPGSATLTFEPGEQLKVFQIGIINDGVSESDEVFGIDLLNPTGAVLIDTALTAVRILDENGNQAVFDNVPPGCRVIQVDQPVETVELLEDSDLTALDGVTLVLEFAFPNAELGVLTPGSVVAVDAGTYLMQPTVTNSTHVQICPRDARPETISGCVRHDLDAGPAGQLDLFVGLGQQIYSWPARGHKVFFYDYDDPREGDGLLRLPPHWIIDQDMHLGFEAESGATSDPRDVSYIFLCGDRTVPPLPDSCASYAIAAGEVLELPDTGSYTLPVQLWRESDYPPLYLQSPRVAGDPPIVYLPQLSYQESRLAPGLRRLVLPGGSLRLEIVSSSLGDNVVIVCVEYPEVVNAATVVAQLNQREPFYSASQLMGAKSTALAMAAAALPTRVPGGSAEQCTEQFSASLPDATAAAPADWFEPPAVSSGGAAAATSVAGLAVGSSVMVMEGLPVAVCRQLAFSWPILQWVRWGTTAAILAGIAIFWIWPTVRQIRRRP